MSAKLHQSLAAGRLIVQNRTSGEVSLYCLGPTGERVHVTIHASRTPVNLEEFGSLQEWRKSPSLAQAVTAGRLDVV